METNITQLIAEIDETLERAVKIFDELDGDEINKVPFENSWTAGQLMNHLLMSNKGFADIMRGPVEDTQRDPSLNIETIRSIFLDFNTKMKSPDFILPPEKDYHKEALKSEFIAVKTQLIKTASSEDLSKTCTAFKLPQLGFLTRMEAIHFVLYHTQRHTHQLENIKQAIKQRETMIAG